MPVLFHFHLLTIAHEITADGFIVTITTNRPCHVYLRYSKVYPRMHRKGTQRRGEAFGWDVRFCFVSYQHLEQDEPGDTITHTFTWPNWENCWTRFFYFWATVGGYEAVSDSPIFWMHYLWVVGPPPVVTIFYPDASPEVTSMDGNTYVDTAWCTWGVIRPMSGTSASTVVTLGQVRIRCGSGPIGACYYQLYRSVMLFDMSVNLGCVVTTAKIHLWGLDKEDDDNVVPWLAVFSSNPASNTTLIPADHLTLGDTPLSDIIAYPDFDPAGWNILTLNAAGIALINAALAGDGIVKLGFREARFDAADIPPWPTTNRNILYFVWESADHVAGHTPYIELT